MKVLYVGHYKPGTTTRARGEQLREILKPDNFFVIDIDVPVDATPRLFRSFGWRFYKGPLIRRINDYLEQQLPDNVHFDIVWIDKGVFIHPAILENFSKRGSKLVHYTPDTAFASNRSDLFFKALPFYDHCITTKSFELGEYKRMGARQVHYSTQGYDPVLHKKYYDFNEKQDIIFIGQHEEWREQVIDALLKGNINISVGGAGWAKFANRNRKNPNFRFLGSGLFHEEYARAISKSKVSLGLLAKKFPELHTTRTFEIPACFTALATERNDEIRSFYREDEVIFFDNIPELVTKLKIVLEDKVYLESLTTKGYQKVHEGGYDYHSILTRLLKDMGII